ncbi:unnamed protein product [Durusdinium trenchii]|uniref:GTPase Obg (GTP-binding protein Obg) n=2 Tax=Durusdinium trenchii TaxID=1381693 RepID=A0ABP0QXL6_9DINO
MAKAGNGGNPAPNALRRPHLPKGPGYGGHGGSVILKATTQIESFLDIPQKVTAPHGADGHDTRRGRTGDDLYLQVPLGTIVRERIFSGYTTEEGRRIFLPQFRYQFLRHLDTYVVAKGGIGGIGPKSFKKGDMRRGTPGQRTRLELELRVLNDVALLGLPNAGKTSLLAAMSRAHTRIGPEEFSTTRPHVGVICFRDRVEVRVCDLPGLKHGAHQDKLMGRRILRHTYRSRALAFVVNVARGEKSEEDVLEEVEMLRQEAIQFDPLNAEKPWMVIGTKCDMLHRDPLFHLDSLFYRLRARYEDEIPVVGTSSRFGLGLTRCVRTLRQLVYPDMLEPRYRLGADPILKEHPKAPHQSSDLGDQVDLIGEAERLQVKQWCWCFLVNTWSKQDSIYIYRYKPSL